MFESNSLQRLHDERQIEYVLIAYCRCLDTMDLDELAMLFTEDCVVSYGPEAALNSKGRDAVRRDLARLWRWRRTAHHLSNIEIRFHDKDRARAMSAVMAWHERVGDDGEVATATVFGRYTDEFVRTGGEWRIANRSMSMAGCDTNFKLNLHALPRQAPPVDWVVPDVEFDR